MLNLYPPLLFNRVRVVSIDPGYRAARVRVARSIFTRNLNGTTFGGTIFTAADPIHAVLYWQIFARRGEKLQVWLKTARIDYRRPAKGTLELVFSVADEDIDTALEDLDRRGRALRSHTVEAIDPSDGTICAVIETEVYMRRLRPGQREVSGF